LVGITVAILQTIPYFGQFVSWSPPVVTALIFQPDAALPALVIMAVGLLILANVVQPRVLGTAVGLTPFAVLAAVLIGGKLAGVLGAVFSVPVAAAAVAIYNGLRQPEPSEVVHEPEEEHVVPAQTDAMPSAKPEPASSD
jgi:predicted PurR-regulated permease PerM